MTIIENSLFLEKNYKSKSSFSEKNPEIKISTIKTDLKENVVEEIYQNNFIVVLEYDENTNITSETWYKETKEEIVYCEKHKFEFDENYNLKKSYFAKFNGPQTNSNWQLVQEYDNTGNIIRIEKDIEGDGNVDIIEEFDNILCNKRKTILDKNGKIINIQHYEYDFNGNLISSTFDKDGDGTVEYEKKYQ